MTCRPSAARTPPRVRADSEKPATFRGPRRECEIADGGAPYLISRSGTRRRGIALKTAFLFSVTLLGTAYGSPDDDPAALNFESHVRPILKTHCFHCHGESADGKLKAKLDVRLRRLLAKG